MVDAEELHSIAVQLEDWYNHQQQVIPWIEDVILELRQLVKDIEERENER